jgi:transcriptional regulator with XRE-family HTH domain
MTRRRLGATVRRLRRRQSLTQMQLAARARLDQGHLSQIESGARPNPGWMTLQKLARALGVPITELVE